MASQSGHTGVVPALPFRVEFGPRAIQDLHRRLDATRWPQLPFATGWDAGTHDGTLRDLVAYWRYDFDWFAVQERLNRVPHVRAPIEGAAGAEMHAVVLARGGAPRVPVVLLHGWPGSFLEFLPAAERLLEDSADGPGLDVVVPSLPGFGFSDPPREPGMHPGRIAEQVHGLMRLLGYERYGVQGGDWGAIVGARLARQHPEAVLGLHLNFPAGIVALESDPPTEEERAYLEWAGAWAEAEGGYSHIQRTRPQTLGYALLDSPVGLLAWMLEKFWRWSDHGEDLWATFDRDAVLANVTLYWLTGTALSSARTYYERAREEPPHVPRARLEVPTAFARYPAEPWQAPRALIERSFDLVRWTEQPRGGHFAAMEQPELFASDVRAFFSRFAPGR
ncbi:MAG: alpha/beta fold hydrolase [Dehalococcoidia bacterium]|nr:alpha/beta fold hydrolase [Dehalococcoidia bacterium]